MSGFRCEIETKGFDVDFETPRRDALRRAGEGLVKEARAQANASGLEASGELIGSIRLNVHGDGSITVGPQGTRRTSDGHKSRGPITNERLAMILAKKGHKLYSIGDSEIEDFKETASEELAKHFRG